MRRRDREVAGLADILAILDRCEVIRLGLCVGNRPYIVPMNFAYEAAGERVAVYLHCVSKGKKLDMIAENNNVCFEADCSYETLAAEKACDWSARFQSVIGEGIIEVLAEDAQKAAALDAMMKRYGFTGRPHYDPKMLAAVTVLKITVTSLTGKSKQ